MASTDTVGRPAVPLDLKVLGVLRILGRAMCFYDIAGSAGSPRTTCMPSSTDLRLGSRKTSTRSHGICNHEGRAQAVLQGYTAPSTIRRSCGATTIIDGGYHKWPQLKRRPR